MEPEANRLSSVGRWNFSPYFLAFVLLFPTLVWIFLDNHVWPWDQAWYGEVSADLYYKLTHSFDVWPKAMITALGFKAPAIVWVGQWFVPLGQILGSIDRALLVSVLIVQYLSVVLAYFILLRISQQKKSVAVLGCLIISSAPLFIGMGHQYFVESLQLLSTILLVFLTVHVRKWSAFIFLVAFCVVLALAMAVKISSPLYGIFPVALIIFYWLRVRSKTLYSIASGQNFPRFLSGIVSKFFIFSSAQTVLESDVSNTQDSVVSQRKRLSEQGRSIPNSLTFCCFRENFFAGFVGVMGISFVLLVFAWYIVNWEEIYQFMQSSSSGTTAELYGTRASFFHKFNFWLAAFQKSFFTVQTSYFLIFLVVFHMFGALRIRDFFRLSISREFFIHALMGVLSIVLALGVFSFQVNEETRYLLPLLIYFAIGVCWLVSVANSRFVMVLAYVFFMWQFIDLSGFTLNLWKIGSEHVSAWIVPVERNIQQKEALQEAIVRTCDEYSSGKINIVGVEVPWLNANSAEYYALQRKFDTGVQCYYTSLGYAENSEEKAWDRVKNVIQPPYFVTIDRNLLLDKSDAFNEVSSSIAERVEQDSSFSEEGRSEQLAPIRVFKNTALQ